MSQVDAIEKKICSPKLALEFLETQLPSYPVHLNKWDAWISTLVPSSSILDTVKQATVIACARMAARNGIVSEHPRAYHNEDHISDLFKRLMICSQHPLARDIPDYGWILLSFFSATHDLRQAEKELTPSTLPVGANEAASFEEALRIVNLVDPNLLFNQHLKKLLKLMIHGSTFGTGENNTGYFFEGSLATKLIHQAEEIPAIDQQLILLACDIDTANVSLNMAQYAQSAVNVFEELRSHHNESHPAQLFFAKQQMKYFTQLQKFNSKLGDAVFSPIKKKYFTHIKELSSIIDGLPKNIPDSQIVHIFLESAQHLSQK